MRRVKVIAFTWQKEAELAASTSVAIRISSSADLPSSSPLPPVEAPSFVLPPARDKGHDLDAHGKHQTPKHTDSMQAIFMRQNRTFDYI